MTLIDNLNEINDCKTAIKTALENKGVVMTTVKFEDYAGKIDALQLESGDTPSTPTPSADYIYSNGYLTNGTETNEIINLIPHEIVLDSNNENKCVFYLTCPAEYPIYDGEHFDIIFTVDVPTSYNIVGFSLYAPLSADADAEGYINQLYKENPRHSTIVRNGVTYNSYVRQVEDNVDCGSEYVATGTLQYRITITIE